MNLQKILVIFRKELFDTLRDRKTLLTMILVPMIMYPALLTFTTQMQVAGQAKLESQLSRVAVEGISLPVLDSILASDSTLKLLATENASKDLEEERIWAYIAGSAESDSLIVHFDGAVERSRLARGRLKEAVQRFRTVYRADTLRALGMEASLLDRYAIGEVNTAPPSRMGSYILGMMLPMMLIMTMVIGAMYPAIDLIAGEKERGTMETILSVPVDRRHLFAGKYLTVAAISIMTACINLLSMMLTFSTGIVQISAVTESFEFTLTPLAVGVTFLMMLPLALFTSAVLMTAAVFARSYKDAQSQMSPVLIVFVLPAMVAMAPGIELNSFMALVPVLNVTLLFKEILLNNFNAGNIFFALLSNTVFALAAVVAAGSMFGTEEALLGSGKGITLNLRRSRITPSRLPSPSGAVLVYAVVMILIFYVGATLQALAVYRGLAITLWGLILLPPLFYTWYTRRDPVATFNLRIFKPLSLLGTLLLTAGALGIGIWTGLLQARLFPESTEFAQALKKILDIQETGLNPWLMYFLVAISPAICEEMLFRGMLLSTLKNRMRGASAVIIVAALFGIAHMNLFRFLPTFFLGLAFSFIVLRTGSIFLSMLAHGLINAFVITLLFVPSLAERFSWQENGAAVAPFWVIPAIVGLTVAGIALIVLDTKEKPEAIHTKEVAGDAPL